MDELNSLKNAWSEIANSNDFKEYTSEELARIVRKRSKNELTKIKRKLFFESGFGLTLAIILVFVVKILNPSDTLYAILFLLSLIGVSFVPYYKVLKLNQTQNPSLKKQLSQTITNFDKLIKQYIRLSTILLPLASLGGFLLGTRTTISQEQWLSFFNATRLLIIAAALILLALLGQWLLKKYFHILYGQNISRLKNCLKELDELNQ